VNGHFDVLAPVFDWTGGHRNPEALRRVLGLPSRGRLLDVGGGTGRVAQALVGHVENLVVADLSRPMLRRAARKAGLSAVLAFAGALPFPPGTFTRVLVVDAFHHFADQEGALKDLFRVVEAGGRLVIEEPDARRAAVKAVGRLERLLGMTSRMRPPEAIAAMASAAGFRTRVEEGGRFSVWIVGEKG
jgi:demethylmenaquinone methyltransferase/2-methoxy-6-polyprenyl-1,4-benzoquinol methylase